MSSWESGHQSHKANGHTEYIQNYLGGDLTSLALKKVRRQLDLTSHFEYGERVHLSAIKVPEPMIGSLDISTGDMGIRHFYGFLGVPLQHLPEAT